MEKRETLLPWFQLKSVAGIGNLLFKRLIEHFGSPEAVLAAAEEELLAVEGISTKVSRAITAKRHGDAAAKNLERSLALGHDIVPLTDPCYPPLLRQIPDPPALLFVCGALDGSARTVSIVGSRHPTEYGISATRKLSHDLSAKGFTVVSGMALGIDTAAHEGALAGGGRTVAVLGSGLDRIYPSENRVLFDRIAASGAVISEFPPGAEPLAHHFPARNRIISGMSLGTIVAEATLRSGSLITAQLAADQGREVFAIPGSIRSFKSTGTHTLIKQGAKLVEHAGDVIEELAPMLGPCHDTGASESSSRPTLSHEQSRVWDALGPYPTHIDDLGRRLAMDSAALSALLVHLELKGAVQQLPGKFFVRTDE